MKLVRIAGYILMFRAQQGQGCESQQVGVKIMQTYIFEITHHLMIPIRMKQTVVVF